MFPDNDKTDNKGELVGESSESRPSTLPEARESPAPTLVSYYQRHIIKDSTKNYIHLFLERIIPFHNFFGDCLECRT
ncbi:unnamed protein product, partial [Vitis vinifera]|uniref:Uncharacterized protein n=1 Tax=Vitis vinifera TaxID=29760 RepID=D7TFZ7_VITVI